MVTWDESVMDSAASNGFLETVKWLYENRKEGCTCKAIDDSCTNGYYETMHWLIHNTQAQYTQKAIDGSVSNGHHKIVQVLLSYGNIPSIEAVEIACFRNYGETLEILFNSGIKFSRNALFALCRTGNCTLVEKLLTNKDSLVDTMDPTCITVRTLCWWYACTNGHTSVLKVLYSNIGSEDEYYGMDYASANGHVDVVEWIYDNTNNYSLQSAEKYAKKYNRSTILSWINKINKR